MASTGAIVRKAILRESQKKLNYMKLIPLTQGQHGETHDLKFYKEVIKKATE